MDVLCPNVSMDFLGTASMGPLSVSTSVADDLGCFLLEEELSPPFVMRSGRASKSEDCDGGGGGGGPVFIDSDKVCGFVILGFPIAPS